MLPPSTIMGMQEDIFNLHQTVLYLRPGYFYVRKSNLSEKKPPGFIKPFI